MDRGARGLTAPAPPTRGPRGRSPQWRGLGAAEWVRLAAWKALAAGTRAAERRGAVDRLAARTAAWERGWVAAHAAAPLPMAAWLRRPGAGALWVAVGDAARWAADGCEPADVALADLTVSGHVDLLGAGPVFVGAEPNARRDLYTGAEWPLDPAWAVRLARGDGSDVRSCWEQSRGYPIVALARAYWAATDEGARCAYRDAFVGLVTGWLRGNPPGRGPNWATPMDLAIRACNWALGAVLFAEAPGLGAEFWGALLGNLRLTAAYVARHLEWHPVWRGNHYVANLVGLAYVGALFRDDARGAAWLRRAHRGLEREVRYQVHPDGAAFEAALGYHRLDTELFAYGAEVLARNVPGAPSAGYRDRVRAMYAFLDAYLPPGGLAPAMGDADDGRLHGVAGAQFAEPRAHRLGLPDGWWPTAPAASAAFPDGGFYVLRAGRDHAVVRCGAVGLAGAGSHDHNDQLAFELVVGGRHVVADSGTYAYTRDLDARLRFRATAAHSVVQLGDDEQNPVRRDRPWRVLGDRTRAHCVAWRAEGDRTHFAGVHHGFAHRPSGAVVRREIDAAAECWRVRDEVTGSGTEPLAWRLHLAPDLTPRPADAAGGASVRDSVHEYVLDGAPGVRLRVELPPGCALAVETSEYSPRYGVRAARACLVARGLTALPASVTLTITADP